MLAALNNWIKNMKSETLVLIKLNNIFVMQMSPKYNICHDKRKNKKERKNHQKHPKIEKGPQIL